MSSWKWCGDCGHRYDLHTGWDSGRPGWGPCEAEGCGCEAFYMTDMP